MRAIYHRSLAIPLVLLVSAVASAADVAWLSDFSQARQLAVQSGKPILIHFYSTHCPPCKLLDAKAFKTPELIQAFEEHLIAVKINVDEHRELADQYQITRWPTDVYLFPNGSELHRMVSPQDPAVYRQVVERVGLRNRDWVAEQNALYAAQQKRIQSAQHATNLRTPAERTPVQETAPGQVPKPVIGRLTSYPLRNDANETVPDKPASVVSASQTAQSQAANASASPSQPELPPIVSGNRYRNQATPFQAAKQNQRETPVQQVNPYAAAAAPVPPVPVLPSQEAPKPTQRVTNPETYNTSIPSEVKQPASVPAVVASSPVGYANPSVTPNASIDSIAKPEEKSTAVASSLVVFDGCCPVTLQKQQRWQQGSQQFGVRHRGRIYYCLSDEARKAFLQDPDAYSPVFSGYDIVEFLEKGIMTEGKREFGCWFRGQVYLFSTKESSDKFVLAKQTFIEEIDKVQNPGRVAERTGVSTQR